LTVFENGCYLKRIGSLLRSSFGNLMADDKAEHSSRLEALWQGEFGNAYTIRNAEVDDKRGAFWTKLFTTHPCQRVLEIGCNRGANLKWVATKVTPREVYGIDVNESALAKVRETLPAVNPLWSRARELPFRDGYFDLVFTCGVLIHQPPETLAEVMSEIVRCSKRYVLAVEYFSETPVEVPYRGQPGSLYKADFGGLYLSKHPSLRLLEKGALGPNDGWDEVTTWLMEKRS
jgi:pseudaminic acid biosynthesis-associated methylase